MSLGKRATRQTSDKALAEARRLAPDRVVAVVWPPLKLAALAADVAILRGDRRGRPANAALRAADWALFACFPLVAGRTPSVAVASGLAAGQGLATAAAMARCPPAAARLLAPQLAWLGYATLVPIVAASRARRAPARGRG